MGITVGNMTFHMDGLETRIGDIERKGTVHSSAEGRGGSVYR